jgi:hypothetical protein
MKHFRRWLELYGRYQFDVLHSGLGGREIDDQIVPLYQYATSDPESFLSEQRAVVREDEGGFATFGAARLVWDMYAEDSLRDPRALPLIDAGIEFKRARDLPSWSLTPYEMERLQQIHREAEPSGGDSR